MTGFCLRIFVSCFFLLFSLLLLTRSRCYCLFHRLNTPFLHIFQRQLCLFVETACVSRRFSHKYRIHLISTVFNKRTSEQTMKKCVKSHKQSVCFWFCSRQETHLRELNLRSICYVFKAAFKNSQVISICCAEKKYFCFYSSYSRKIRIFLQPL